MARSDENPLRWEGGPVALAPSLQVVSSVIGGADDSWMFAAIEIEPTPCISLDAVMAHYPEVTLKAAPTGHSVYEQAPLGDLLLAFRSNAPPDRGLGV
jgi:hypothetical protein